MDYATIVDRAVKEFYSVGSNEAHSWLLQVQASPEAWQFVWELLDPSKSGEVQFFAATTLHTKIIKQWDEVPENDYPMLRDYLVKSLKQPNTPKFVLLKLCQAFAAFMVNSYNVAKVEEDTSIVDDLFNALTPTNSQSMLELLLRVLSLLPAECERRRQMCGNSHILVSGWRKTLCCLRLIFSSCDTLTWSPTLMIPGLECTLAWFKTDRLPLEAIGQIYSDLLVMAPHYAPDRSSNSSCSEHERGWEIVQECLIIIVTHRDLNKWPQTLWEWARVLTTTAKEHNTKYFCEVLTAIGETHSREFLIALAGGSNDMTHKQTAADLVELLLECTSQPGRYPTDETRSSIPFGFWYALQDDLATLDQPVDKWALLALKPIYTRLAEALLEKSTLPCRQELSNANEREVFRCYRQDVADTLDYCYKVLQEDLLKMVLERLGRAICNDKSWTDVEASLHAFKALAEAVGSRNVRYVSEMIDAILSYIPYDRYPAEVMATACSALGAFAEWIGEHPDRRLKEVLQFITLGLTKGPAIAPFASMALKDVVRESGNHIKPFALSILDTIRQALPSVAPGSGEALRLMYATGKMLNTLPEELQLTYLDATLGVCIVKVKELLEQPLFVARAGVTSHLKMIVACLSTLEGTIGKVVLDGLIPLFHQIIAHPEWSQDNLTLEAMYLCAQRSLPLLLRPETDARPLLSILTASYKTWPHQGALNLLRHLILLFGRDQDNVIRSVLAEISSITLSGVKACKSVQGDLSDWSDLMEAYLGVLAQICKKNVGLLLQIPDQIPDMLQCGMACLTLPEISTVKIAGSFLSHAIAQTPHMQTFVQPIGQELVSVILHHVVGAATQNHLEPCAEVLFTLNKFYFEWHDVWLRAVFESQSDSAVLPKEYTTHILRERTKKGLCTTLKELSMRCRQKTGLSSNPRNDRTFETLT
ncbi:PREDICTED: importin-13 [Dinoponera quadriceps]|uniref:Importin-13 n=1 Tax=Dinoponera quadriceps TaxID=609295 RepID=A0A6P3WVG7_DINQU|nr:PREDICTED: importin-13 [Dinoponera quadriceps]XP_014469640.1 PREDICTED: importin-13 [Dinoponera quadriceps]